MHARKITGKEVCSLGDVNSQGRQRTLLSVVVDARVMGELQNRSGSVYLLARKNHNQRKESSLAGRMPLFLYRLLVREKRTTENGHRR